ncbi:MAG: RidA family protein [Alphaproteobacteria bacterium]|nr:RidA family protein [Alphaproteobacteria bacterium]MCB9931354.1 RidA family protein [Alphaproteobacteria bacterium]
MTRRLISSGSALERTAGYSRAVVDGDLVFVAGCTGLDYATNTLAEDAEAQTRQAFRNIEWALQQARCSLSQVVRATYYVTDRADVPAILKVCGEHFRDIRPASTLLVCGLVRPEMKIEIEVTARIPSTDEDRN